MTREEVQGLVAMLAATWTRPPVHAETVKAYCFALADLELEAARAAVLHLMQTSEFFPTIAAIRKAAVRGRVSLPTAEQAWGIVHRAIGKHGSYRVPCFDCDEIQQAVDAIGWKEICLAEGDAARASNRARWLEAYKGLVARRLEDEATGRYRPPERQLPADVGEDHREPGDVRALVVTGYATSRLALHAAPPSPVAESARQLVEGVTARLAGRK